MSCRRPSTTTDARRRGTTLLEVCISLALFLGMSMVLASLMRQNQRANLKIEGQNDATAQMMLVFEKVRNEVRHSRIIGSDATTQGLLYWICRCDNGIPQVIAATGQPDWLPGGGAVPDQALLYYDAPPTGSDRQGVIYREFPKGSGKKTPIALVGKSGSFKVFWSPEARKVTLVGTCGESSPHDVAHNNLAKYSYDIYVVNNE